MFGKRCKLFSFEIPFQNFHLGDKISGKTFANTARMEHREDLRKVGKSEKTTLLFYLFDM